MSFASCVWGQTGATRNIIFVAHMQHFCHKKHACTHVPYNKDASLIGFLLVLIALALASALALALLAPALALALALAQL